MVRLSKTRQGEGPNMGSKYNFLLPVLAAAFLYETVSFAQENRGTPEQRAACSPDALRLCANDVPDPKKVEDCLRRKKSKLSDQCRLLFEQNAGATAARNR
jgi:hypothetical protein